MADKGSIISDFIVFLSGATGGKLVDFLIQRWRDRQRKKGVTHKSALVDSVEIMSILSGIVKTTSIDRAALFVGSNGGSKPRPGHIYRVSAVYDEHKLEPKQRLVDRYHQIRIDLEYGNMLRTIIENESSVLIETEALPPCILRSFYEAESVKRARVYYLAADEKELFYLSFATYDANNKLVEPSDIAAITVAVDQIKDILSKYTTEK